RNGPASEILTMSGSENEVSEAEPEGVVVIVVGVEAEVEILIDVEILGRLPTGEGSLQERIGTEPRIAALLHAEKRIHMYPAVGGGTTGIEGAAHSLALSRALAPILARRTLDIAEGMALRPCGDTDELQADQGLLLGIAGIAWECRLAQGEAGAHIVTMS